MAVARTVVGAPTLPARTARGRGVATGLAAAAAAVLLSGLLGLAVALAPGLLRTLTAFALALVFLALTFARPRAGILVLTGFFVSMTFLRRLLIEPAGWTSLDPIVLVGPLVVGALLVRLFTLDRRRLAPDALSKLMVAVVVISLLEIPNPRGGGIAGGLGGVLLVVVPTLWFFVGRELASAKLTTRLLQLVVAFGLVEAAYGLLQTQIGFPSWDLDWFFVNGYSSLNVGDSVRAFGTFSSSAEYALFVGAAAAVAAAAAINRRWIAGLALPLLLVALFFSSSRGALVSSFTAMVVIVSLVPRRPKFAVLIGLGAVVLSFGALTVFGSALSGSAGGSGNDLVTHQVDGITDPLNPGSSTLLTHLTLVVDGIVLGISHPFGSGTGATNQAGSKLSGTEGQQATEVDVSNAFVNLGLVGGLLYLVLVAGVLTSAFRSYFAGVSLMLPVIAVLIVTLGQWGTGGLYAIGPIVWLLAGYVVATGNGIRAGAVRASGTADRPPVGRRPEVLA